MVYPRGCGGADASVGSLRVTVGLSPRVRGSLKPTHENGRVIRSIPAGAGEPEMLAIQ